MKKTETKSTVLPAHHLKSLRLPTTPAEYEQMNARCPKSQVSPQSRLIGIHRVRGMKFAALARKELNQGESTCSTFD